MPDLYKLSDDDLQTRSNDGDLEAARVLQDRVIVRGLVSNDPTYTDQHWTWLDTELCLHFKRSAAHPQRVRLILKIDESITQEFLELNWPEVTRWQKFLRNLQGPEPSGTESASPQGNFPISRSDPPPWLRLDRDNDQRPYVSMLLNDTITVRNVKNKRWGTWVRSWQQFLREDFGPNPYSKDGYLSRLHSQHEQGKSYAELARQVHMDAIDQLYRYVKRGWLDGESLRREEWSEDEAKHWEEQCSAALHGFEMLGCRRDAIRSWLRRVLNHLTSNREAPVVCYDLVEGEEIYGLVERQKIIDALKTFRDRGKKGLGVRKHKKT